MRKTLVALTAAVVTLSVVLFAGVDPSSASTAQVPPVEGMVDSLGEIPLVGGLLDNIFHALKIV